MASMTFQDVEKNFNDALQAAIDTGTAPGSGLGFDQDTFNAILEVAREYPDATAVSVQNAQQAWRREVSGAARADADALISGIAATRGWSGGDSLA